MRRAHETNSVDADHSSFVSTTLDEVSFMDFKRSENKYLSFLSLQVNFLPNIYESTTTSQEVNAYKLTVMSRKSHCLPIVRISSRLRPMWWSFVFPRNSNWTNWVDVNCNAKDTTIIKRVANVHDDAANMNVVAHLSMSIKQNTLQFQPFHHRRLFNIHQLRLKKAIKVLRTFSISREVFAPNFKACSNLGSVEAQRKNAMTTSKIFLMTQKMQNITFSIMVHQRTSKQLIVLRISSQNALHNAPKHTERNYGLNFSGW